MMSILTIIREIITEKQKKKIVPCYALRLEVLARCTKPRATVEAEISELVEFGMIISHPTICDTSFEINNDDEQTGDNDL